MKLTRIDMNSWIFYIGGHTILVDPWLVDPLVFYGAPWLFTAYHNTPLAFTPSTLPPIDLILISQGLDDHCHQPTLEKLDRQIPVIASPTAAKTVQGLGYTQVLSLTNWQSHSIQDKLKITAVPGAPIQPGQVENGYVLQDLTTQETLYYEPHLFPKQAGLEQRFEQIDVAIAPVIGQLFPLLGQVVMGPEQALHLTTTLQPRFFVPTTMGNIRASGILPMLTKSVGSLDEFRTQLNSTKSTTELVTPQPGETIELVNC